MSEYVRFWAVTLSVGFVAGMLAVLLITVIPITSPLLAMVMGGGSTLTGVVVAGWLQL